MSKQNTRRTQPTSTRRHDKPADIQRANGEMREAWKLGRQLTERLGERAAYGAMKEAAGGDESTAEKFRKLRSMASRVTEKELRTVFELCELHGRRWGPSHLVALSRLAKANDRRRMAKIAIQDGWGLAEIQRRIRRMLGPQRDAARVGRKMQVDLTDEAEIVDQINSLCVGWMRFAGQLQDADVEGDVKIGLALLPKKIREQFVEVAELATDLQMRAEKRLRQKNR